MHTQESAELAQQNKKTPSKAQLRPDKEEESLKVAGEKEAFAFECEFVEPPPCVFQTECSICSLVLCDPYQSQCCGTSMCHLCILGNSVVPVVRK